MLRRRGSSKARVSKLNERLQLRRPGDRIWSRHRIELAAPIGSGHNFKCAKGAVDWQCLPRIDGPTICPHSGAGRQPVAPPHEGPSRCDAVESKFGIIKVEWLA
jgi:hypothetical protein